MNFGIYEAILMKLGGNLTNHIKMGKKQKKARKFKNWRENSKKSTLQASGGHNNGGRGSYNP